MIRLPEESQLRAVAREPHRLASRSGPGSKDQEAKVTVSATHWRPWDDLDIAEWILLGRRLGAIGRGVAWWIGDWVNYGNAKFGEKYARAARVTGYDVQSLMNMAYVASKFDDSRRRESLSWSHHAELAGLAVEHQDMWLEDAEHKRLSVRGLREAVRTWRAQQLGAGPDDPEQPDGGQLEGDAGQPGGEAGQAGAAMARGPDGHKVVCPQCGYRLGPEADSC
jgi:hypothetical protein